MNEKETQEKKTIFNAKVLLNISTNNLNFKH